MKKNGSIPAASGEVVTAAHRGTATSLGTPLLEVRDLRVDFHQGPQVVRAVDGLSYTLQPGRTLALVGESGSGKTVSSRAIMGLLPGSAAVNGSIKFDGRELGETPPQEIVRLGISQSPEGRRCFPRMTVRENLELGAYLRSDNIDSDLERVYDLFPRLKEREKQKAGTMSGGEQQMLAIGRALMSNPRLLLLDEPAMGLAPVLVERIYETIAEINRQGTTILLVEQNANFALDVSKRGYVLETGTVALSDESQALRENPEVQRAYLGA